MLMFVVGTFGRHGLKSHQAWSFCMLVAQLLERLKKNSYFMYFAPIIGVMSYR